MALSKLPASQLEGTIADTTLPEIPTSKFPDTLDLSSKRLILPTGNTAGRPGSPVAGEMRYNSQIGSNEYWYGDKWVQFGAPIGTAGNPASSGIALKAEGYQTGYYYITINGASKYVYVDNDRNEGGWILAATVRKASNQAHYTASAVGLSGDNGPTYGSGQTSTQKLSFTDINAIRGASTYTGNTAWWLEGYNWDNVSGNRNMFVNSNASIAMGSADAANERTQVTTTYQGSLSDRNPNTGTHTFGDHHTSGGTYFAYQRHPEQGNNSGFRSDNLGGGDGYLWVK